MIPELQRIKETVEKYSDQKAQNLASNINKITLIAIHKKMDRKKAVGIDGVTKDAYEEKLEENIDRLITKMKHESYKPKASRRVYIDKPGSDKKRPLGISCYEDKLVENAISQLLEIVYEPKFCERSYGFRPERGCHDAIIELIEDIQYGKINYIVEADIRSFFDKLDHEWLMKFLEYDIADVKFLELIKKFLKSGVMDNGKWSEKQEGSPQGNGASPILANIYLHYVLDLWFEKAVKKACRGEAHIVRYADDFVCCFQYKNDAEKFYEWLEKRFAKFGLELATEKTKILEFGRFAEQDRKAREEKKPETFNFLGFTFYCSKDKKKQFFRVKVKTDKKKMTSKITKLNEWLKTNRHKSVEWIFKRINQLLLGYYHYYGVTDNSRSIGEFKYHVGKLLFKWLNRRSQRSSYSWDTFNKGLLVTLPLANPKIYKSLLPRG